MKKLLSLFGMLIAALALGAPVSNARTLPKKPACFAMIVSLDGSGHDTSCP